MPAVNLEHVVQIVGVASSRLNDLLDALAPCLEHRVRNLAVERAEDVLVISQDCLIVTFQNEDVLNERLQALLPGIKIHLKPFLLGYRRLFPVEFRQFLFPKGLFGLQVFLDASAFVYDILQLLVASY